MWMSIDIFHICVGALVFPKKETDMDSKRFTRGWERLGEIDGEAGRHVIDSLAQICPDLGRYIVEFGFGDVYSRPGLTLREREIATIAALAAMGTAAPQLAVHIKAGLNVGLTREEIMEVIIQMALYAGFPASLNAAFTAASAFEANEPHGRTEGGEG